MSIPVDKSARARMRRLQSSRPAWCRSLELWTELAMKRDHPETRCESCGWDGRLYVDHCHTTGKYRGILCYMCNKALGLMSDDAVLLRQLADYVDKSKV